MYPVFHALVDEGCYIWSSEASWEGEGSVVALFAALEGERERESAPSFIPESQGGGGGDWVDLFTVYVRINTGY